MGVIRYEKGSAAPTKEQRERSMKGERKELHFGPEGQTVLILYPEAAYLNNDIGDVRILFSGHNDKQKVQDEVRRLEEYHRQIDSRTGSFTSGREG
ncbi:MAG: hypothetical protein WAK10_01575 [Methanoregula sp.]